MASTPGASLGRQRRVSDPKGLLPQNLDGLWMPRKLLVGVIYGNGAYRGARNTGVDATGHDYQLIIPAGVPFTLRLFSHDITLTDEAGIAVDLSGSRIPFEASPDKQQNFSFTVAGVTRQ
jgi:hypothetical protein